jgi:hypothetical protein
MSTLKKFSMIGCAAASALVIGALATSAAYADAAPANAAAAKAWKVGRTLEGQPDLQGNWTNATITPFERDAKYGANRAMPAADAKSLENAEQAGNEAASKPTAPGTRIQDLPVDCGRGFTGTNCGYNSFWVDPGTKIMNINGEYRTSMIISPENGKTPALTEDAKQRMAARMAAFRGSSRSDNPETLSLGERCILSFGSSAGPPMIPLLYNNNYQIVQNKDTVLILVEMVHDARIVRLNGTHPPQSVRKWMGDSIGHWEGDTLVVETTNIRREQAFRGASDDLKVIERFTRTSPMQVVYHFEIQDPKTFTAPLVGEVAMNSSQDKIYEYACHEGNYALPGILAGAREEERAKAAAAAQTGSK